MKMFKEEGTKNLQFSSNLKDNKLHLNKSLLNKKRLKLPLINNNHQSKKNKNKETSDLKSKQQEELLLDPMIRRNQPSLRAKNSSCCKWQKTS
jgi:hypothetical protein